MLALVRSSENAVLSQLLILWLTEICVRFLSPPPPISANLKSVRILAVIRTDSAYLPSCVGRLWVIFSTFFMCLQSLETEPFLTRKLRFSAEPQTETLTKPASSIVKPIIKS